ncbi:putative receptor-like protein kinase At3g47110 [Benincasa hispida]|uniref:putative receptor-like protein kinase At3g47110 n=1 Tax=Benincasa hispida TaxID=102211 RepID=UPI001900FB0A|nr:putative receptor-like protein kinase At3g47110 [Benincasa hispida]
MSSWNDSTHFCNWVGVTCNTTLKRIVALRLEARKLVGLLPPSLGNLTYLRAINLGDNHFHGPIPQEFGKLQQLRYLNLSFNNFSGEIPSNMSHCIELVVLQIGNNELIGQIPHQFFMLTKLEQLRCQSNQLTGDIPSWIGNLSSIFDLCFPYNHFEGKIPSEVGRLSRLKFFAVDANYLTGTVPLSLFNITSLTQLSLTQNKFHGNLPQNIGSTLPNLQFFYGGINYFRGPIPTSFVNASRLRVLDISQNNITGMIPDGLGSLRDLELLNFVNNKLGTGKVGDLNFINSLTNCTSLKILGLAVNRFGGPLPSSIANLSTQLIYLLLSGNILPSNIGNLQNLEEILLQGNELTGPIPSSIGNLSSLNKLNMSYNKVEGSIPPSLGRCRSLQVLDLSHNNLSGNIPKEVIGLSSLSIYLGLGHNSLNGSLPSEVGELNNLAQLDVSENILSGEIPINLGKCTSMERLDLGGNQFEGTIPQSLAALKGLEKLNLSNNNLSGLIPQFLGKLHSLKYLDLSYNNFEGQLPKGGVFSNSTMVFVFGNKNLCDGLPELHLPPCASNQTHLHSNKPFLKSNVLIPTAFAITFVGILVIIIFVCFVLKKSRKDASTNSSSAKEFLPQISYLELNKSTEGFSIDNLIGSGSFASVYKGVFSNDGSIVAIKVFNLQQQGASKSFIDECNALSKIRHRNLLKIITSCSSIDGQGNEFKALVFNFMSNGNLDVWLHPTNDGTNKKRLSIIQRLNVTIDIACGLDYLHNYCETPIIHCDLNPNNILLDDDMVAHVGDFGLARFMLKESNYHISFSQIMSLALKGSIGYIPPEYGSGSKISIEGDVFSYGILLLEMIIGKRPTHSTFDNGVDIHLFIARALPHDALKIIDPSIVFEETCREEEIEEEMQEIAIMS